MNLDRTSQPITEVMTELDIPHPHRSVLPNGIPLEVLKVGTQQVVRFDLIFAAGRCQQTHLLQALFTNRMLREGSSRYSGKTIAEQLDYYGAWLELSCSMNHSYVTLYALNRHFNETMALVEDMVKAPLFPQEELSVVLANNLQHHRVNLSKTDFLARRQLNKVLFQNHPYGQSADEAHYQAVCREWLNEFHQTHYVSGNCSITLSGHITDSVLEIVKQRWGQEPFGHDGRSSLAPLPAWEVNVQKRFFIERPNSAQSTLLMGAHSINFHHPDFLKLRVLITLFGGYFGSRLMSNIREQKGYTYGIGASLYPFRETGVLNIHTEADSRYMTPIIEQVYAEMDRLHREPVGREELSMVKNYLLGEMCRSHENLFSLADSWNFIRINELDDLYFSRSWEAIKEVDADELQRLACLYLCKENLKEVIVGQKAD